MSFDTPIPPYNASDPHATFLSASCLDLLLIEIVPMAERLARHASGVDAEVQHHGSAQTDGSLTGASGMRTDGDDERVRDAMFWRLDSLGYRVGQGLSERFSRDRPRFTDDLDVIKFLCKDLWTIVFRKQIDNLKTNHRGVYVLTDNKFALFGRMSTAMRAETIARAQPHLWFPCGLIRGALASLGINATLHAYTSEIPIAIFEIRSQGAKT
ncbi:MAG: hypothetical protein Q9227_006336 [Pyrenula ochraceoflavens]